MDRIIKYEKTKRCTCTLYVTEKCNINCVYCYEQTKSNAVISLEIAQKGIIETFERAKQENIEYVEILFHGGEPFLAFNRIKEICEWVWNQEWSIKYICYATTNGTLIHGEIKKWLLENKKRFIVGLSLDGTPEMHNKNRSNSYSKIDIPFFRDNWSEQGVKMTPSPGTLSTLAQGIIHLHDLNLKNTSCTFAGGVDWSKDETGNDLDYASVLQEQLAILASYYIKNPTLKPVEMINIKFLAVAAGKDNFTQKLCGAGTIMRCWTPDGQCLPCHLFYEVSKERGEKLENFDLSSPCKLSDPKCSNCVLEPICPTCYGGNFITYGDITKRDPYTCMITKIRALASSWMIGQMLMEPLKYNALSEYSPDELAMTAKGVILTQEYLEDSGSLCD